MSAPARLQAISSQLVSTPKGLLAGEVAIITGVRSSFAAQGIGQSCALLFAKEGAKVVVADLDEKKAQIVVDEIKKAGGEAIAVGGDVTAQDYPKKLIKATVDRYGGLNHIVNNAGFTFDKMLHTMNDDTFELMLKVHNTAPFRLIREAAPYLRVKDPKLLATNRSIVNVSSTSGLHGNVGQANYAVAKAGVVGLTKTIAKEWGAFNVRCNTVAFGYIKSRLTAAKELGEFIEVNGQKVALGIPGQGKGKQTDSDRLPDIPLGRPGEPEEAASAVLFLCSPLASYVSGHTLEVTGGRGI
ncbi:BQ5605_C002g01674 [Microbotryum silenes-dioicae]|uniref:BQ5605_C002g01674 protein n=1 Tax=Microbotryum silenes-dioicae TaxID=796604 RepID=A0A2X0NWW1_9BASI|nr:BQ5605_C002g01674 [Microbotryum silenes-dioicae]